MKIQLSIFFLFLLFCLKINFKKLYSEAILEPNNVNNLSEIYKKALSGDVNYFNNISYFIDANNTMV
jgi:hypothetical protein